MDKMNEINLEQMITAIKTVAPKAPLSPRGEHEFIFRGCRLLIHNNEATSDRINFGFCDAETFITRLRDHGLMLKPHEVEKILARYYLETI